METFLVLVFVTLLIWGVSRSLSNRLNELSRRVDALDGRLSELEIKLQAPAAALTLKEEEELKSSSVPQTPLVLKTPTPTPEPVPPPNAPLPRLAETAKTATAPPTKMPSIEWEKFMGVKLFAWLGGFALFLATAFFVKYSFEHDLISPLVRVLLGYAFGVGLIFTGLALQKKGYVITVQTLCSAGVSILYTDVFACRVVYDFFSTEAAFLFTVLVTVASFLLSVRLVSRYVAVLPLIGGFLTPPLLSTGVDRPIMLFSYIALLDLGLVAVSIRMRWGFLVVLSAVATYLTEWGWTAQFFHVNNAFLAFVIYLSFSVFYLLASELARWRKQADQLFHAPSGFIPLVSMGFVGNMLSHPSLGARPGLVLTLLLLFGAQLAYAAFRQDFLRAMHLIGGIVAFFLLGFWTLAYLKPALLAWGLSYYLIFAVLHAVVPIALERIQPTTRSFVWGNLFPSLMLLLVIFGMLSANTLSFLIWPFILLIGMVATMAAWMVDRVWVAGVTLLVIMAVFATWLLRMPNVAGLPDILTVLAFFIVVFFAGGLFVTGRPSLISVAGAGTLGRNSEPFQAIQLPSLSALLPYFLLAMVCATLPINNPSQVFALMALLVFLLLGLVRYRGTDVVALLALFSTTAVEVVWHYKNFRPAAAVWPMLWYLIFYGLFTLFPFVFRKHVKGSFSWLASALAGPVQFYLIYLAVSESVGTAYIGLLPVPFALLSLLGLYRISKTVAKQEPQRMTQLALFGGVALFFITLIVPLQFEKEWLTLGWALEGLALIWLFRRIPHGGLKGWGLSLLGIVFVRLALNPSVLSYHARGSWPVLNWYLYIYGTAVACLLLAARLLAPPRNLWLGQNMPPVLNLLGTVLAFLLLNIEIADYYSTGKSITFQFSGNLAQDMTYSLGWGGFAFILLIIGIRSGSKGARFGSLSLLSMTIVKVFLHDLWKLGQLYRVASIFGLASILILVSFLYQKYLSKEKKE